MCVCVCVSVCVCERVCVCVCVIYNRQQWRRLRPSRAVAPQEKKNERTCVHVIYCARLHIKYLADEKRGGHISCTNETKTFDYFHVNTCFHVGRKCRSRKDNSILAVRGCGNQLGSHSPP